MEAGFRPRGDYRLTDPAIIDTHTSNSPSKHANDPTSTSKQPVTVLGAGPAGALMSILFAARGHRVTALERLPDLRHTKNMAGRSINLALADRGIHALKVAGVFKSIEPLMVPMRGRMLHDEGGQQSFLPYGSGPHEVIYSISRSRLTAALLDFAERERHVELRFRQNCISVDRKERSLSMQDIPTGRLYPLPLHRVIGADGAGSVLRHFLAEDTGSTSIDEMHSHGYKELVIASGANGEFRLEPNALHVWPRGQFMLIALPNQDGSFTATLFMPHDGPESFTGLTTDASIIAFFRRYFSDALPLIADLAEQFATHPTGTIGTVNCDRWTRGEELVLIGDAAHAIVPFHGQGMNCAFEDCIALDALTATESWGIACLEFQTRRKPNCDAIATMALENYIEMRDTVRDPRFQLQKALSLELERRHPRFIPRYSMVMFHHEIPYATALARGRIQADILMELTRDAESLAAIDYARADRLIEARLPPLG
jgi:kynurenine 3-monooxygenase